MLTLNKSRLLPLLFAVLVVGLLVVPTVALAAPGAPPAAVPEGEMFRLLQTELPSISIDISLIFTYATQIFNMMMPIVGVGAGISFGFALVAYIIRLFRNIF
jgi:hypothetical protein